TAEQDEAVRAVSLGLRLTFPARILLFRAAGLRVLGHVEQWTVEQAEQNLVWLVDRVGSVVVERSGQVAPMAHREEQVVAILPAEVDAAGIAATMLGRCPFAGVELAAGVSRSGGDAGARPRGV